MQFDLKQQQIEFIGAPEQFVSYVGAIGTGKSTALIIKALAHSKESPKNLGIIVRKNFTDLRDSTIKDYEMYTGRHVHEGNKEDVLPNGSVILFRHGDEINVLKNISAGFFLIEQAEEFDSPLVWDMLIQRLRRKVKFRCGGLVANANGHNWIWDKFIKNGTPENHRCVQATTYDFKDILPEDYIKNLEANLPEKMFKRFVLNSYDTAEGIVFDQFEYETNTVMDYQIPDTWKTGFVLDHGFTHPTAVLWFARDNDGNVIVFDEHEEAQKPVSYHAGVMKSKHKDLIGWCDPSIVAKTQSRGDKVYSIQDEYMDYGITLIPARRASEQYRINHVNEYFKKGKLKIFKSCVNTIREVQNWKWKTPTGKSLEVKEEPVDFQNDTCDCLSYLVEMLYEETVSKEIVVERYSPEWYVRQRREQNSGSIFKPDSEDMINVINRNF